MSKLCPDCKIPMRSIGKMQAGSLTREETVECRNCEGTGDFEGIKDCPACNGTGTMGEK